MATETMTPLEKLAARDRALRLSLPAEAPQIVKDLGEETLRANRHARPLSIVLLEFDIRDGVAASAIEAHRRKIFNAFQMRVFERMRGSDLSGLVGDSGYLVILPETPAEGAEIAAKKLCEGAYLHRLAERAASALDRLRVGVATFSDAHWSVADLIEAASNDARPLGRNGLPDVPAQSRAPEANFRHSAPVSATQSPS